MSLKIYKLYESLMKGFTDMYDEIVKVKIIAPIKQLAPDNSSSCDSYEEELINQEN